MKFGKIDRTELEGIDWALPETRFVCEGECSKPKISVGGTMWTIRPWRGSVYPQKDPMRTWPEHYGRQFGNIEFNATHYRIYSPEKMASWADRMPNDFKFCPKFPALISHYRRFNNCEGPTDDFIEGILALGNKLGPAFLQLPPQYSPKHADKLFSYLESWPRELKMAIEFRHPLWFEKDCDWIWSKLSSLGIGSVISDTAGRRDALHMKITAPFVVVRFGGYDGHESDKIRLENWVSWLRHNKGVESFYFLVHQTNSVHTPHTCIEFSELCKKSIGAQVKAPNLYLP